MVGRRLQICALAAVFSLAASARAGRRLSAAASAASTDLRAAAGAGLLQWLVSARLRRRRHERATIRSTTCRTRPTPATASSSTPDQRRRCSSAAASATSGTTGCALRAPPNIGQVARLCLRPLHRSVAALLDTYDGNLKSWVFLANAFVDLGTWNCFTPFVGAGVGARLQHAHRLHRRQSVERRVRHRRIRANGTSPGRSTPACPTRCPRISGRSHLPVSQLRLGHRHGRLLRRLQSRLLQVRQFYSHDIMLGFRWMCCDLAGARPPPRDVYTPPSGLRPPQPLRSLRAAASGLFTAAAVAQQGLTHV